LFGTWPGEPDDGFEEAINALRRFDRKAECGINDREIAHTIKQLHYWRIKSIMAAKHSNLLPFGLFLPEVV
ncbi:MAG: hypothetical protein OXU29_05425, partial [Gammaproteobacteria bacterium]|nr:hypothetical protein [Gammaproteobacteria bacterium]